MGHLAAHSQGGPVSILFRTALLAPNNQQHIYVLCLLWATCDMDRQTYFGFGISNKTRQCKNRLMGFWGRTNRNHDRR